MQLISVCSNSVQWYLLYLQSNSLILQICVLYLFLPIAGISVFVERDCNVDKKKYFFFVKDHHFRKLPLKMV